MGGFAYGASRMSEMCVTACTTMAMIKFGYDPDLPKLSSAIKWILNDQKENGWRCGWRRGFIDGWEPISPFAAYLRAKWNRRIKRTVERGAEFYLERGLYNEGRYAPWKRFHYPVDYYHDILVGLDFLTSLGHTKDRRMHSAISLLKEKSRGDGRWNLEAAHPDLEGSIAILYSKRHPTSFSLERRIPG